MSVLRTVHIVIFLICVLFICSGCPIYYFYHVREECRPWVNTFFRIPANEQNVKFRSYDIETQYVIYICGMQVIHPPNILADTFAMGGEDVVDLLKIKLSQADNDETISNIVLVFDSINRRKTYDVPGDNELMKMLTDNVVKIKNNFWRQMAEEDIRSIITSHISEQCRFLLTTFFRMPVEEKYDKFRSYDVETQYEIYRCGMQKTHQMIHPNPNMGLPDTFAMGGNEVVNLLKVKLLQAKDDEVISDIVRVFSRIDLLKTYDVMGDSELMKILTDSVAKIKDDYWRKIAERDLSDIMKK